MARRALSITAIVLLVLGFLTLVSGAVLLALFGTGGQLSSGTRPFSTPTRALVSSLAQIEDTATASTFLGRSRIEVSATPRTGEHGAFVGIARASDVDRYLAGAAVDIVDDFDVMPFRLTTHRREGAAVPAAPASQSFWVARADAPTGTADVSWAVTDGTYRVVVMNSDAAAGVNVDGNVSVVIPQAFGLGMLVMAVAVALVLSGGAVLVVALLMPTRPTPPPTYASQIPPPASRESQAVPAGPGSTPEEPSRGDEVRSTSP
jgi:hypothetical protein